MERIEQTRTSKLNSFLLLRRKKLGVGLSPFVYQWFHDNAAIPGATAATYFVTQATPDDAGIYQVQVLNSQGMAISAEAFLAVVQ
jgi:hypothetical protein